MFWKYTFFFLISWDNCFNWEIVKTSEKISVKSWMFRYRIFIRFSWKWNLRNNCVSFIWTRTNPLQYAPVHTMRKIFLWDMNLYQILHTYITRSLECQIFRLQNTSILPAITSSYKVLFVILIIFNCLKGLYSWNWSLLYSLYGLYLGIYNREYRTVSSFGMTNRIMAIY